jgi:hypothetical protein
VDIAVNAWRIGFVLAPKERIVTVLALVQKAPTATSQRSLLYLDIETEVRTPICSLYKHLANVEDIHGWTPLTLARQLKRPYKISALTEHADDLDPSRVMGLRPSRLEDSELNPDGLLEHKLLADGLEFSTVEGHLIPDSPPDPKSLDQGRSPVRLS